ncbi:trihelix transcription factor DF1-like [Diospyros lotus]|uniref:trihelix transcription factor DF1-like n=1 Tax=Diospyros lotus TaxID=55363 RepID=UPI002259F380|nr:trihelix transcription factor DF1-like [Diospyros lotus]
MLGVSAVLGASTGDGAADDAHQQSFGNGAAAAAAAAEVGSSSGGLSEEEKLRFEEGDRNSGGNRWPRQETLALLKIRSEMDLAFRDSSLKGPLWEEVSRKLSELGYHRSAKKCKEKFENVYKYHKRTREGRASKQDGKTYRFFDQLEALDNHPAPLSILPAPSRPQSHQTAPPPQPAAPTNPPVVAAATTVSSATNTLNPMNQFPQPAEVQANPTNLSFNAAIPLNSYQNKSAGPASASSDSSTSSDEEPERRQHRKRKWTDFFQRLMNEVIEKQEQMQKKLLDALEKRERDRVAREEAWRIQEMARMNREHDLLVQERSMAAAKDAAVIAFLQKVSQQQNIPNVNVIPQTQPLPDNPPPPPAPPPPQQPVLHTAPTPPPPPPQPQQQPEKRDNGVENLMAASPSRWPKAEVQALIGLRKNLDLKYQENGPKGPLWEEISSGMKKLGYNRSSKRCKEKWENINKYFKKVKESNKKRPEDSKTCPYFHQLDALYREKAKNENNSLNPSMVPIMVQPEQQWPLAQDQQQPALMDQNNHHDELDEEEDDEEEEDEAGGFEIVANKPAASVGTVE